MEKYWINFIEKICSYLQNNSKNDFFSNNEKDIFDSIDKDKLIEIFEEYKKNFYIIWYKKDKFKKLHNNEKEIIYQLWKLINKFGYQNVVETLNFLSIKDIIKNMKNWNIITKE